jgi:WD40 repeat protein
MFSTSPKPTTPQDEEGPLPSSSSSDLAQQASSSFIPKTLPLDLMADLIIPFVPDRATWNSVCCASKEVHLAGKKTTPPWPNKAFELGHAVLRFVAISPSGSQLVFCINNTGQPIIHVWDRWGKETLLACHPTEMLCLECSLDGEYLASGSRDGSIRLWHAESFHVTSTKTHRERATQTPKQANIVLFGSHRYYCRSMTLSFSRTDSNLLASGGSDGGEINVWNIKEQACIHSIESGGVDIQSLFFVGGDDIACLAVADTGSVIRLWRPEGSSDFATETIVGESDRGGNALGAVFSPSGSFLATMMFGSNTSTLVLHQLETMTKTQTVVMPDFSAACFAVSPDSKHLVVGDHTGRIRLLQTDDLSIRRDLDTRGGSSNIPVSSVALDPTCRVLAFGRSDGRLELRTLQM